MTSTTHKSTILLSMHKAGSSIADIILTDFCTELGMDLDRLWLQVSKSELREAEYFKQYQDKMSLEGVYYGVARGPYVAEMPIISKLKTIVHVRDPRDCITSSYFSYRESHKLPEDPKKREAFIARREQMQTMEIDEFALSLVNNYIGRMQVLKEIVENHDDVLLLKYEDMVTHTNRWLSQIAGFLGQPVTGDLRKKLGDKIDFTVSQEDSSRHKRQVTPGDHKRKLEAGTINKMNKRLEEQLTFFGYAD